MNEFIAKFSDRLQGVLSGFDRLLMRYLSAASILLKDFGRHVLCNPCDHRPLLGALRM